MNKKLQNKLYKKYPKIFRQKDLPKEKSAMCWGIDCPDEWYDVIDSLCESIQTFCENNKESIDQIEAMQVKEKFGKLCFYTNKTEAWIRGAIFMANSMISHISVKRRKKL